MVVMRYTARVGFVGYTPKDVQNMASIGRSVAIYNGLVYDLTTYIASPPAIMTSAGTQPPSGIDVNFMDGDILNLFQLYGGTDITKRLNSLKIDRNVLSWQKTCLRNLFTIGKVDNRQSPQCLFSNDILLVPWLPSSVSNFWRQLTLLRLVPLKITTNLSSAKFLVIPKVILRFAGLSTLWLR